MLETFSRKVFNFAELAVILKTFSAYGKVFSFTELYLATKPLVEGL